MRAFAFLLLICFATNLTVAQPRQAKPEDASTDEKKAVELRWLNELIDEIGALRLAENRAFALARVASALWTHDEKRARKLYDEAFAELVSAQTEMPARRDREFDRLTFGISPRHDMIYEVEVRDAALALRLLDLSRPARLNEILESAPPENRSLTDFAQREKELIDRLSLRAASAEDHIKKLREIIKKAPNKEALDALRKLKSTDPEIASELAALACDRLAADNYKPEDSRLWLVASYLKFAADKKAPDSNEPLVDPAISRRLAEKLVAVWLANPDRSFNGFDTVSDVLKSLTPEAFSRLEVIRKATAAKYAGADSVRIARLSLDSSSADAVRAEINSVSANSRDQLRSLSASKYLSAGQADKAESVIENELSGENAQYARNNFYRELVTYHLKNNAVGQALGAAHKIDESSPRASAFIQIASAVSQNEELGGPRRAESILLEAIRTIDLSQPTRLELSAADNLAYHIFDYDPERAFELAETMLRTIDEVAHATAVASAFNRSGVTKSGEVRYSVSPIVDSFGTVSLLRRLMEKDERRTRNTIALISRHEMRVWLKLSIVAPSNGNFRMTLTRVLRTMSFY